MSRLIMLRRRGRDRGAVAVLVAVLLAGNVLLGMGALAVDVGLLYVEREELQSGADAAAVAVAKACAVDITACTQADMSAKAGRYARDNAKDGLADAQLCGRALRPGPPVTNQLLDCVDDPNDPGNLTECIGTAPSAGNYIQVRTSTRRSATSTAMPPAFAGAITGATGTTLAACSRASWGPVSTATVDIVAAISICPFNKPTANGTVFQRRPSGPHRHNVADPRYEVPPHWETADDTGCKLTPDGSRQMTDGFIWLTGSGFADCSAPLRVGTWYDDLMTRTTPSRCIDKLRDAYRTSTPLTVAIFADRRTISGQIQVKVAGFASFVVTGWWTPPFWPSGPEEDHVADVHGTHLINVEGCRIGNMCVYGYFTTKLVPTGNGPVGEPTYGTYYVRTIG